MTDPISIQQLRERAELKDPIYNSPLTWVKFTVPEALALLDLAQAAHELADRLTDSIADEFGFGEYYDPPLLNNLREAVARFTFK